jgi:transketolase N-terminal domain/subunit/spore coat polysaccharide biosynthesis protein SpsF (cytidylyltransferase family)
MNVKEQHILAIIQTRRGSTRLPDKVVLPLEGKPLFVRQAERVKAARLCGQVVIATTTTREDDVIAEICRHEGLDCYRGHPQDLLDRHYQAALRYGGETVIKIPSDCPLIDPVIIDKVIGYWLEHPGEYDFVSNLHPATWPDGNDVEVMTLQALEQAWYEADRPMEREHTTPFIWERPKRFRIGNVTMGGGLDYSMTHRFTIDYEADYRLIRAVFEELYPVDPLFGVEAILGLLGRRPELYAINAKLAGVNWYRHHLGELKTVSAAQTKREAEIDTLKATALRVREHIIRMAEGGGCFIGASLSCVEMMVYLYARVIRRNRDGSDDPERDYLFLSKGHDVPALYGTFAEMGFLDADRLSHHLSTSDHIYWHPNRQIPGVEFHSGSLGHLPAVAAGVALDCKLCGSRNRVVVITGDGELNEGSVWETLLVANAYGLDNLTLVVDRNQFQANIRTEELVPLEPLADKFRAFGCVVQRIDGHDFFELEQAFEPVIQLQQTAGNGVIHGAGGKVRVIIADTVRGKGLPSIEARADRWFCSFTGKEVEDLLEELHGNKEAAIESETLVVR